jgi:hypothetical protein
MSTEAPVPVEAASQPIEVRPGILEAIEAIAADCRVDPEGFLSEIVVPAGGE